ncbi:uncharacterized protein LOC114716068 [Neltuma alba]|uniref:uncharacterized protein LOC114716068 n=1 Tax=Neltuma alba TaxID=207710 RepID=UPI0010A2F675|nr:uncharacterized protein LOC114716068 [Prosopis alba]
MTRTGSSLSQKWKQEDAEEHMGTWPKYRLISTSCFRGTCISPSLEVGSPGFGPLDTFGILAALPEDEPSPNARNTSHLFHKASVSSTSSSSSRSIPAIPKPPQERIPSYTSSSSVKYPQSAPVNVPVMSPAMMMARSRRREFDEDFDDEGDESEEMLPPHQAVARNSAQSPMLASSVLEGAGRTLKGRDLRQVRNAVWRQTGFLD